MHTQTRDTIVNRLKKAAHPAPETPAPLAPLAHSLMDADALKDAFVQNLTMLGAEVHGVDSREAILSVLKTVLDDAGMTRLCVSEDPALESLSLESWCREQGIELVRASDCTDRKAYTESVFEEKTLGFTTACAAVAESGTLVLNHDKTQPRLVSLAPLIHVALVFRDRLVPIYEDLPAKGVLGENLPSQTTLVTGPSMTADIQATPFKGSRQEYTMANIALHIISIDAHGKTTRFKQITKGGIFIYIIKRMPLSIMETLFPFLD